MAIAILFLVAWLGVSIYAVRRGGQPERIAGALFLAAFPLTFLAYRLPWKAGGVEWGIALVDLTMLIILGVLAARANRLWPIPMLALQIFQVGSHFTRLASPEISPLVYWVGNVVWAYFQLPLLLLATIRHVNRERRSGKERSWVPSLSREKPPIS